MVIFKRVIELDMMFPYLVFYINLSLGTMFEFLFIIGFLLVLVTFVIVLGHLKENDKIKLVGKVLNVVITFAAFSNHFIIILEPLTYS